MASDHELRPAVSNSESLLNPFQPSSARLSEVGQLYVTDFTLKISILEQR